PYAMPSKRMVSMSLAFTPSPIGGGLGWGHAHSRPHPGLPPVGEGENSLRLARVLHILDHVELHVVELAVLLLDLADVDVVHDVARLGIDEHRAARALEDLALHGIEQGLAATGALGL